MIGVIFEILIAIIFTRSARIGGYWSAPSMFKIQTPDSTRLNTIEYRIE